METGLTPRAYRDHLAGEPEPLTARSATDAATVDLLEPSPLIGLALHHSHRIREELHPKLVISAEDRRYEEDPETHRFLGTLTHRITPNQSRYEVDMNRPPGTCVYLTPEMAWGNEIWADELTREQREISEEKWYEFHQLVDVAVEDAIERFGRAVVLDVHSYNYQREAAADWRTDGKPVINLGTRHLDPDDEGKRLVDAFLDRLRSHTVLGEEALVEENSVFYGGYLNRRLSRRYGPRCITLSVEYKKVFMDERTGEVHEEILGDLRGQLDDTLRWLAEELDAPVNDPPTVPQTVGSDGPRRVRPGA